MTESGTQDAETAISRKAAKGAKHDKRGLNRRGGSRLGRILQRQSLDPPAVGGVPTAISFHDEWLAGFERDNGYGGYAG